MDDIAHYKRKIMVENDDFSLNAAVFRFSDTLSAEKTKRGSVKKLSEKTGIPARTLESYLGKKTRPDFENFLMIFQGLGASFANEILEPLGITGAYDKDPAKLTGFAVISHAAHFSHLLSLLRRHTAIKPEEMRVIKNQLSAIVGQIEGML